MIAVEPDVKLINNMSNMKQRPYVTNLMKYSMINHKMVRQLQMKNFRAKFGDIFDNPCFIFIRDDIQSFI